ncbi:MAG: hypothetical protein FWC94_01725 [Bacteroidales bacterium]|nr:hypothetical protein [Bacteroidales bacterium]
MSRSARHDGGADSGKEKKMERLHRSIFFSHFLKTLVIPNSFDYAQDKLRRGIHLLLIFRYTDRAKFILQQLQL